MNRILLLLALVLASSACRKPLPSPDFIEASNRYTSLLALDGDEALLSPAMDEVAAQLARVPAKSSDHAAAQALIATIASERKRVTAAQAQAAIVVPLPAPNFPPMPVAAVEPEPAAAAAVPVAPAEFGAGAAFAPLQAKYPGCLLSAGPLTLMTPKGVETQTEAFELHDSAHCRTRIPVLVNALAVVNAGKVVQVLPKSSVKTSAALEDGGAVPGP